ncbi:MAG: hypothetical protein ABR520_06470 [Mycobacteriales bacterium]
MNESLAFVQRAVEQRDRGASGEGVVVVSGLAEVVLQAKERIQLGAECGRAAFEEGVSGEQMSFATALVVSDALSERHDLAGDGYPLGTRAGCPQDVVAGEQAGGKRRGVVEAASDCYGVFAERLRSCSVLGH